MKELREKIEAGEKPEYDCFIFGPERHGLWCDIWDACDGSVDAALALLEVTLPGWHWGVMSEPDGCDKPGAFVAAPMSSEIGYEGENDTAARALLIAILKALEAQEGER